MALKRGKAISTADVVAWKATIEALAGHSALDQAKTSTPILKEPASNIVTSVVATSKASLIKTFVPATSSVETPHFTPLVVQPTQSSIDESEIINLN